MSIAKLKLIPKKERDNLFTWFKEKDYSYLNNITIGEYLVEIEERLELYHFAVLCNGDCRSDPRWKKLTRQPRKVHKMVPNVSKTGEINWIPETSKENKVRWFSDMNKPKNPDKSSNINAQLKASERATAWNLETEGVVPIKGKDLYILLQRKEAMNVKTQYVPPKWGEDIQEYTIKSSVKMNQKEYLFPFQKEKKQILTSLDIGNFSDEDILKQIAALLPAIRNKIGVPEPVQNTGNNPNLQSLRKFLDNKAIQYLDILLYSLIASPSNECWRIPDSLFVTLLFNIDSSSSSVIDRYTDAFSKTRQRFYNKELLIEDYVQTLFTNIRSDVSNTELSTDCLYVKIDREPVVN